MTDKEKEYMKIFKSEKRTAKHWLTTSAHRAHSSTIGLMKPAKLTLDFIISIEENKISFEEKVKLLFDFYNEQDQIEKNSIHIGSGYYFNGIQHIKSLMNKNF